MDIERDEKGRIKAIGLRWRKRAGDREIPVWVADDRAIERGYPVKTANLDSLFKRINDAIPGADRVLAEKTLVARCQRLQDEMRLWLSGGMSKSKFDGTFRSIIETWETDPESPYHVLKPGSLRPYRFYAERLKRHIGEVRVDQSDGRDVKRWFKVWARVDHIDHPNALRDPAAKLAAATTAFAVLKSAVSFGVACRNPGCAEFIVILNELSFPAPKSRNHAPTAAQIIEVRKAAHAAGRPERALAYALQFDTTLRQWDVIGQWIPLSDQRMSQVLHKDLKWVGPTWANIDENLILKITPSKTENTTEAKVVHDLKVCPMVIEELQYWPVEKRKGPLIVSAKTGLPYMQPTWAPAWRADATAAKIPAWIWNRDIRAGGNTEAQMAEVPIEDRARTAGHSKRTNAEVYSRDTLEAQRRAMQKRTTFRSSRDEKS